MNNKIIASVICLLFLGIVFVYKNAPQPSFEKPKTSVVFTKINKSNNLNQAEIKREEVSKEKYMSRLPDYLKRYKTRDGRVLIGANIEEYIDPNKELKFNNYQNHEWKNLLGVELLKFQLTETKVEIKEEFSAIKIYEGMATYCEQVVITYIQKNGDETSFRALVNSETGKIEDTWDRNISEKKANTFSQKLTVSPMENVKGF